MAEELEAFVQESLRQISKGSVGNTLTGDVEFEVAITKVQEADGKVGIKVIGIGGAGTRGKIKSEHLSKIKFSVRPKGAWNKIAPMKWPPSK